MGAPNPDALPASHWIFALFDAHAQSYFGEPLPHPTIIAKPIETKNGLVVNGNGVRMMWLDTARLAERRLASDTLLHEMIHYWLAEHGAGDGDVQHGDRFRAKAEEIGRALGFKVAKVLPEWASSWPQVHREFEREQTSVREISPAENLDAAGFYATLSADGRAVVDAIRTEKAAGARARPSSRAIILGHAALAARRAELLDKVAALVDENIFGRSEMCEQFAVLVREALVALGVKAFVRGGTASYAQSDGEWFHWRHAWVVAEDVIIDGNVDSMGENIMVPEGLSPAPYWGPRKRLPPDRRLPQTGSSAVEADGDVRNVWLPELMAWMVEKEWIDAE